MSFSHHNQHPSYSKGCSCAHDPSDYKQSSTYTAVHSYGVPPPRPPLFCHEQSFLIDTHLLSTRSHLSPPTCLRRSSVALSALLGPSFYQAPNSHARVPHRSKQVQERRSNGVGLLYGSSNFFRQQQTSNRETRTRA